MEAEEGLDDDKLRSGVPLSAALEFDRSIFRQSGERDVPARVMRAGGGGWWYALFTPPLSKFRMARSWAEATVHSRPRIGTLGHLPAAEPWAPEHYQLVAFEHGRAGAHRRTRLVIAAALGVPPCELETPRAAIS